MADPILTKLAEIEKRAEYASGRELTDEVSDAVSDLPLLCESLRSLLKALDNEDHEADATSKCGLCRALSAIGQKLGGGE